jgi:hypothetical protein
MKNLSGETNPLNSIGKNDLMLFTMRSGKKCHQLNRPVMCFFWQRKLKNGFIFRPI